MYPALYQASDRASLTAQRRHFLLLGIQLTLFVAAAIFAGGAAALPQTCRPPFTVTTAITLGLGLLFLLLFRLRRDERFWFQCRAIAESVKTTGWRYMMKAPPFDLDDRAITDRRFVDALNEIRRTMVDIHPLLTTTGLAGPEITPRMREIRALLLAERKLLYIDDRISDQRRWYQAKCAFNQRRASLWFWTVFGLQCAALTIAVIQVATGSLPVNIVALLMTLAATFVAWSQAKRHDDLVQPYALAAQELISLQALAQQVNDEANFRELVIQVEEAISREHTMWCAKRNVSLAPRAV